MSQKCRSIFFRLTFLCIWNILLPHKKTRTKRVYSTATMFFARQLLGAAGRG
nr:MAG TPA: hypothetical protein [Caudoviricetes sp.]